MDSISVKIPVTIKAKLTEKLKARILEDLDNNLKNVDLELQQMDIQEKRVVAEQAQQDLQRVQAIHEQFAMERQKRLDFKAQAEAKVAETKKLAIGAEIIQGTLERNAGCSTQRSPCWENHRCRRAADNSRNWWLS